MRLLKLPKRAQNGAVAHAYFCFAKMELPRRRHEQGTIKPSATSKYPMSNLCVTVCVDSI